MDHIPADQQHHQNTKPTARSPLRYPGGKSKAVKFLLPLLPQTPSRLFSPFLGGGSLELAAAAAGWVVAATDASIDVITFWQALLNDSNALADEVERNFPVSRQRFYELQKAEFDCDLKRAAAFFICNRSSFGGTTYSGGYSPGRFTQSSIQRLRDFRAPNLHVEPTADFRESIPQHPYHYLFLDGPYASACGLYGRKGDLHTDCDCDLREVLRGREGFILCGPDTRELRGLYSHCNIVDLTWAWGIGNKKRGKEVVILSPDLAAMHGLAPRRLISLP